MRDEMAHRIGLGSKKTPLAKQTQTSTILDQQTKHHSLSACRNCTTAKL
jgi:hypothetical protein